MSRSLTFDDHKLLQELCGPHDQHLAILEKAFAVHINMRGNVLMLSGDESQVDLAAIILNDLHLQLEQGLAITHADVQAAIRLLPQEVYKSATSSQEQADQVELSLQQKDMTEAKYDPLKGQDVRGPEEKLRDAQVAKEMAKDKVASKDATGGKAVSGRILGLQKKTIRPRTISQAAYFDAMAKYEMTFGVGPAGTGKTYLAVAWAAHLLLSGDVDKIILSRPAVEAGEQIGFLPGDMKEKVDPYLRPLYDALYDVLHTDFVDRRISSGDIEIAPLGFMRGRTFTRAAVILDEAQNATVGQMKMFLTRMGEGSRMVITGDPSQTDLPPKEKSGLWDALRLLKNVNGIGFAEFTAKDVVRHELVGRIVAAYDKRDTALREKYEQRDAEKAEKKKEADKPPLRSRGMRGNPKSNPAIRNKPTEMDMG